MFHIAAVVVLLCQAVSSQTSDDLFWRRYIVDNDSATGAFTSLDFDNEGQAHIAYTTRADLELGKGVKYAFFDGARWQIEMVDAAGAGRLNLAIDSQNRPHIVYGTDNQTTIMYATKQNGNWILKPLLTAMSVGQAIYDRDIATIDGDVVHIMFTTDNDPRPNTEYSVVYMSVSEGLLGEPYRIKNGIVGKWGSMTLGENNLPAVAFWGNGGDLFFAAFDGEQWLIDNVDNDGYVNNQGFYPSITYGNDGTYYIAFQSHDPRKLRLASGQSGGWKIEDIVDLGGWHLYSTPNPMVQRADGGLAVAYYDIENADLMLMQKIKGVWSSASIASSGSVGLYASMALNAEGLPAVSFYNETHRRLEFMSASLTEPLDRDNDLLPDYLELYAGLDPLDMDFDDDGLGDGEEDANHNGLVEAGESDPRLFDSDGDGLSDGLEAGRTNGLTGSGEILGTNPARFIADADPSTTTDNHKRDSDADGLDDGVEDVNHDGRMDIEETDPTNPDTDGDGLNDWGEYNLYTSPFDVDSDNDGLSDGDEDINGDNEIGEGETSPIFFDTDGDGLSDGLEVGLVDGYADPDGGGRLKATRMDIFIPDADPATRTNPTKADSDDDALGDGEEDANENGRVDTGETDPARWDTDGDGSGDGDEVRFGTDPLNGNVGVDVTLLFAETFAEPGLSNWTIVDNGDIEGPSNWQVYRKALYQLSNINDGVDSYDSTYCMRGSYIWAGDAEWQDYVISLKLRSEDDDAIGLMFRYVDDDNYYRISMSKELGKIWFMRFSEGECRIVAEKAFDYQLGIWHDARLYATGSDFAFQLDGETILEASDDQIERGAFALYSWKNAGAGFSDVDVVQLELITEIKRIFAFEQVDVFMQDGGRHLNIDFICPDEAIGLELSGRQGEGVYERINAQRLSHASASGTRRAQFVDKQPWLHSSYLLTLLKANGEAIGRLPLEISDHLLQGFHLTPGYPNPFSSQTSWRLYAARSAVVEFRIFNVLGQQVFSGSKRIRASCWEQLNWSGLDSRYRLVPNGVYFIHINIKNAGEYGRIFASYRHKIVQAR